MTERQVINIVERLRRRCAPHLLGLCEKHQETPEWKAATAEHIRWTVKLALAKFAAGVKDDDLFTLTHSGEFDRDRADEFVSEMKKDPERFRDLLADASQKSLDSLRARYIETFVLMKRGVVKSQREIYEQEYRYRFTVFMCFGFLREEGVRQKLRRFSDGRETLGFDRKLYERIFRTTKEQADVIEADVIATLTAHPL